MSKAKKSTAVAVSGLQDLVALGQEGIPGLLEKVVAQITALRGSTKEEASTSGKDLPGFGQIKDIVKVSILIQAHSAVVNRAIAYKKSADALGISLLKFPFKLEGCTENQWVSDITIYVALLSNRVELIKLNKIKKTLEDNLSQEAKLKNDLAKIAGLLTDDSPLED